MKNLKMMVKLLLGFGIVAALVLVVAVFGLQGAQKLGTRIRDIGNMSMPQVESLMAIDKEMMTVDDSENSLLAASLSAKLRQEAYNTFDQSKKTIDAEMKAFENIEMTSTEKTRWKALTSEIDKWWQDHLKFVELAKAYEASPTAANMTAMTQWGLNNGMVSFNAASKDLEQMIQMQRTEAKSTVATASGEVDQVRVIAVAAMIGGPLLAILLGIFLSLSISRPLVRSVKFAETVASGNFTHRLDINQRDEIGALAASLNDMSGRLSDLIITIRDSASQVAASSEQISSGTQLMSQDAQVQASTVEETAAAMEELSASVAQVNEHAQNQVAAVETGATSMNQVAQSIKEISDSLVEISELAGKSVENALEGANSVREVVEGITLIADSSERIAGIVTIISEISDQTNLLALNASIEAARAGEHGRGFAVVADEVSRLADRSSSSAKEIEALIKESVKNVNSGVEIATSSQEPMEQIRGASQKVKDMIVNLTASMKQQQTAVTELTGALENVKEMSESISVATEEQTTNAKQVSKAVENVSELTQRTSASTEEMSSSTEELSSMAQELQSQTAQFKVAGIDQNERARALSAPQSTYTSHSAERASSGKMFAWTDSMMAHITSIDEQRKALVDELSGLRRAILEGKEKGAVLRLVNHFVDTAGSLFRAEEDHSVRSGLGRELPAIHQAFAEKVRRLSDSCDGSNSTACLNVVDELQQWLGRHFTLAQSETAGANGHAVFN